MTYTYAPAGVTYGEPGGTYGDWGDDEAEPEATTGGVLIRPRRRRRGRTHEHRPPPPPVYRMAVAFDLAHTFDIAAGITLDPAPVELIADIDVAFVAALSHGIAVDTQAQITVALDHGTATSTLVFDEDDDDLLLLLTS